MTGLKDDTLADKAFRFCLGFALGVGVTWYNATQGAVTLGVGFVTGVIAVLFGNGFVEWFIRSFRRV